MLRLVWAEHLSNVEVLEKMERKTSVEISRENDEETVSIDFHAHRIY